MDKVKMVIAVRKDLDMTYGKIAAQVAHAAMKIFFDRMKIERISNFCSFKAKIEIITEPMKDWMTNSFTKIVVWINSEKELWALSEQAKKEKIPYAIMIDGGIPKLGDKKAPTCIAIGPDYSDEIDKITRGLELI